MEWKLTNSHGTSVVLCDAGASVRRVETVDRLGNFSNIALSPCASDENLSRIAYAGATLGPSAGRVPDGWLLMGGQRLSLTQNEGVHHLHGGLRNLSDERWLCVGADRAAARFLCDVEAGRDGYPGNRRFTVDYTLSEDDRLTIRLRAETDAPTWVSLSNHLYWNLSGDFSTTVDDHSLRISAGRAYWNNAEHIPAECRTVAGTPFDFRDAALLGPRLAIADAQLLASRGYNNLYLLQSVSAAELAHAPSGRVVRLSTDLPALVCYSGGYLDGSLALAEGGYANAACALALEPQLLPVTSFARQASAITTPDKPFDHWIAYDFGVEA